ncbi:uncharacterized protein ColSpa_06746 [Colletotrichum spaethianum]|uniref:Uncharacterized protein n=1 Tax=Colletotrichum spaethianum TaxID=700344 RepID=A0AA37P1C5_9PEZI|nr:uncharacterized protein ColSpa_06746 [Colletotrichum spaethianum]GKT46565.1 hypothetical protein ColSpa_06746 [Colletotrichum spaethianum]
MAAAVWGGQHLQLHVELARWSQPLSGGGGGTESIDTDSRSSRFSRPSRVEQRQGAHGRALSA